MKVADIMAFIRLEIDHYRVFFLDLKYWKDVIKKGVIYAGKYLY